MADASRRVPGSGRRHIKPPPRRRGDAGANPGRGARSGGGERSGEGRRRSGDARGGDKRPPRHEPAHLADDIVRDLRGSARPGKGDILVQVFSEAMGAFAAGDLPEALRLGEQAKHLALRSTHAREFLGLAYYHAGKWREAARELSAFRRIAGSEEQDHVIADCYRALGKPDKAIELCDGLDSRRVSREVFYEGAIVAAAAEADGGDLDAAIERVERLELEPVVAEEHHLRAWYLLADLLERKGRFSQARRWFGAVAAADPEATDAPERMRRLG